MSWYAGHQQILHNIIEDNTLHLFLSIFRGTYVLCLILKTTLKNNQKMFLFFKGEKKKELRNFTWLTQIQVVGSFFFFALHWFPQ